jgi:hypothetical protein
VDALQVALERRRGALGVGRAALGQRGDLLAPRRPAVRGLRGERQLGGAGLRALLAPGGVLLRAGDDDLQVLRRGGGLRELRAQRAARRLGLGQARLERGQARARALGLRAARDEEALGFRTAGLEPAAWRPTSSRRPTVRWSSARAASSSFVSAAIRRSAASRRSAPWVRSASRERTRSRTCSSRADAERRASSSSMRARNASSAAVEALRWASSRSAWRAATRARSAALSAAPSLKEGPPHKQL